MDGIFVVSGTGFEDVEVLGRRNGLRICWVTLPRKVNDEDDDAIEDFRGLDGSAETVDCRRCALS